MNGVGDNKLFEVSVVIESVTFDYGYGLSEVSCGDFDFTSRVYLLTLRNGVSLLAAARIVNGLEGKDFRPTCKKLHVLSVAPYTARNAFFVCVLRACHIGFRIPTLKGRGRNDIGSIGNGKFELFAEFYGDAGGGVVSFGLKFTLTVKVEGYGIGLRRPASVKRSVFTKVVSVARLVLFSVTGCGVVPTGEVITVSFGGFGYGHYVGIVVSSLDILASVDVEGKLINVNFELGGVKSFAVRFVCGNDNGVLARLIESGRNGPCGHRIAFGGCGYRTGGTR